MATPEEARRTLNEIENRQRRSAAAAVTSRWWWIGGGAFLAAYGALLGFVPAFGRSWGSTVTWVLVLAAVLWSSRWGSALLGRQVSPRPVLSRRVRIIAVVVGVIVLVALQVVLMHVGVPHLAAWFGIAGGLVLAIAGPWWQGHVLDRTARL
ncbi:hypothetical protein [Winogradskya humida]|uniref:Uncharacterized protein n=1 Tax=Winogradskya humida TaxID=113566 RepID=A0ABQ3ZTC6_9ACTN|nr:hypothetical protein [Actinoplanes humidus]GIE21829.1 hypothetical protein Ahu01nite_049310 [Actinoplanes humidus]